MNELSVRGLLTQENVKAKFQEILKDRAAGFTANLAVMVSNSEALSKCEPMSVISAAVISASLDLPLDPNLGFAAVVPYGNKAQFQIMYKGLNQLAMRTGQYKTIGVSEIYEGQLESENPLTGDYVFNFDNKTSSKIIGFAAYFRLLNGFEKTVYWPVEKINAHGKKYSKSFNNINGRWKEDFEAMSRKTVLKHLLSKWGILSIEMQTAIIADQSVVRGGIDDQETSFEYVDNDKISPEKIEPETHTDPFKAEKPKSEKVYKTEVEAKKDFENGLLSKDEYQDICFNIAIK